MFFGNTLRNTNLSGQTFQWGHINMTVKCSLIASYELMSDGSKCVIRKTLKKNAWSICISWFQNQTDISAVRSCQRFSCAVTAVRF